MNDRKRAALEAIAYDDATSPADRLRALEMLGEQAGRPFLPEVENVAPEEMAEEQRVLSEPIRMTPRAFAKALRAWQAKGGDPARLLRYLDADDLERQIERAAQARAREIADPARVEARAEELAAAKYRGRAFAAVATDDAAAVESTGVPGGGNGPDGAREAGSVRETRSLGVPEGIDPAAGWGRSRRGFRGR